MHRHAMARAPIAGSSGGRGWCSLDAGCWRRFRSVLDCVRESEPGVDRRHPRSGSGSADRAKAFPGRERTDRVHTRVRDLRSDELGNGYDLVFLSAICHMLSEEENCDLLALCRAALATGGRLVIEDFILRPDKTAPKWAALFALNMLVGTRGGSS